MAHIAILGAGYMGSARSPCPPPTTGTRWPSGALTSTGAWWRRVRAGRRHPRLGLRLPRAVVPFPAEELRGGAGRRRPRGERGDLGRRAVAVLRRAAPHLPPGVPVLSVSKGLTRSRGRIVTLSTAVAETTGLRLVTVGGPSKAMELARRVPTAVMYALAGRARADGGAARWPRPTTPSPRLADQRGLELCSALKNAYAIAVGLCDGLVEAGRAEAMYNTKSLIYTQAVAEIARLGRRIGARPETVYGLGASAISTSPRWPGATASSAKLRGAGLATRTVVRRLARRDQLTEGYAAIRWCWRFAAARRGGGPARCARSIASSTAVGTSSAASCAPPAGAPLPCPTPRPNPQTQATPKPQPGGRR